MSDAPGPVEDSTGDFQELGSAPIANRVRLELGSATHAGRVRENNEDSFLVARLERTLSVRSSSLAALNASRPSEEPGHLLIIADGMGGAQGGERASALAVETLVSCVLNDFRSFLRTCQEDEEILACELKAALEQADRVVLGTARTDPDLEGMGTTVTMAYGVGALLYVVHAGDSRAYLYRDGDLRQVTRDHTLVQMMVTGGLLSPEDAKTHQRRNVVTNVVGGPGEGVFAEVHKLALVDGDVVLLCSDGLSEPVDQPTIAAILGREADPQVAADALVAEALERGGPDNVTVVLARVHAGR